MRDRKHDTYGKFLKWSKQLHFLSQEEGRDGGEPESASHDQASLSESPVHSDRSHSQARLIFQPWKQADATCVECGQININSSRKECREAQKGKTFATNQRSSDMKYLQPCGGHSCLHVWLKLRTLNVTGFMLLWPCVTLFGFHSQINYGLSDCTYQTENTRAALPRLFP